jgi:hypothetical protein
MATMVATLVILIFFQAHLVGMLGKLNQTIKQTNHSEMKIRMWKQHV